MSLDLQRKTFLVTGANAGIGRAITEQLVTRGAHVVLLCRRADAGEETRAALADLPGSTSLVVADLSDPDAVARAGAEVVETRPQLDAVIHNAGVYAPQLRRAPDGVEFTFATNHLGPFRLTRWLLPAVQAAGGRIVVVSSMSHRDARLDLDDLDWEARPYHGYTAYANSKLAGVLFARELARRLDGRVPVNAVHPGVIRTEFAQDEPGLLRALIRVGKWLMPGPHWGARGPVWLATSERGGALTGAYLSGTRVRTPSAAARDDALAASLWERSEDLSPGLPPLTGP